MESGGSRAGQSGIAIQFCLLALAWGASFLFIKIGLDGLSPAQVVWARMVFGALALGAIMLIARRPVPRDAALWGHLTVVTILLCVVPFLLFSWAEQHISSSLASIYNATTPLTTMAFAAVVLSTERITRDRGTGLVLGFAGVLLIIGPWSIAGEHNLLAQLACLGATTCYGLAFTYLRKFVSPRGVPAVTVAFIQVSAGAAIMVLATPLLAGSPMTLTWPVVSSMIALGAVSTGLAYIMNTNIVAAWGAANAAAVTYVTPIVGVVLGIIVLDEPLSWNQPVGAVLVIAGILTAHGRLTQLSARMKQPESTRTGR
ncbi:DMT family transporter [Amycolatopsis cihanbeyliensis]|uniref:Drug/metabolite transporter (DMT)-like permease n=1 Tax=Amycolatopsis cihanbeyliensis TaxID=1128664 RepID=A0A542DBI9_AMYCI|nr:DMT family transporter [Amycolatopsis cihanbeyliensis]TQJ00441.1 drug/metabolite transporter (DMT)-like permease [Amycolatopsis cihanbeyliensis]